MSFDLAGMRTDTNVRTAGAGLDIERFRREAHRMLDGLLNEEQIEKFLARALKQSMRESLDNWTDSVRGRYRVHDKAHDRALKIKGFNGMRADGSVSISGPVQALTYFDFSPTQAPKPTRQGSFPGPRAAVLHERSVRQMKRSPTAPFVTKFKSGHVAIVRRVPGEKYIKQAELMERTRKKWDLTRIEQDLGPSVAQMYGNEKVMKEMEGHFFEHMDRYFSINLAKAVEKAGGQVVSK